MARNSWQQAVSCRDASGRDRDVKVLLGELEIVIVSPPGEVIRLTSDESMLLRAALKDAENEQGQK